MTTAERKITQAKFQSRVETVTPEIAVKWLEEKNVNNRRLNDPLKDRTVEAYARDMQHDRWHLTGDAIKFDVYGDLLDGQHRLWACVVSDTAFKTLVAYGVDPDARIVIDTGKKRTFGHYLQMQQTVDPNVLAAVVTLAFRWDNGNIAGDGTVTGPKMVVSHEDALTWYEENPDVADSVRFARAFHRDTKFGLTQAGVAHYLNARVDAESADTFWDAAASGANLAAGSPILAMRRFAANAAAQRARGGATKSEVVLVYFLKAMQLWKSGKSVRVLHVRTGERVTTWSR